MRTVLAIDPGKATGICVGEQQGDQWNVVSQLELDPFNTGMLIEHYTSLGPTTEVVCEAFTIGQHTLTKTFAPWSLELIGVAKYFCEKNGCSFKLQKPFEGKGPVDNNTVRLAGLWVKGSEGHAHDAARHYIVYQAAKGRMRIPRASDAPATLPPS